MLHPKKLFISACLSLLISSCVLVENQPTRPEEPQQETGSRQPAQTEAETTRATPIKEPEPEVEADIKTAPEPAGDESADTTEEITEPVAAIIEEPEKKPAESDQLVIDLCEEIGGKLGSVDTEDCLSQKLMHSAFSVEGRSLAYRDFEPLANREPLGRILVIGGIHGDEFSSVSVVFKWMNILRQHHSGLFHWRFIPSANPDGLLLDKAQRQNASGVDLNRNFPTQDWNELALKYWKEKAYSNARRYPGPYANSELETQWLVEQMDQFNPDIIISMHAPYHLVDYDGPPAAPKRLGGLYLRQLGVYPGSLGNYIGVDRQKPIVTVELKSAGIMPGEGEIDRMWTDLIRWLRNQLG